MSKILLIALSFLAVQTANANPEQTIINDFVITAPDNIVDPTELPKQLSSRNNMFSHHGTYYDWGRGRDGWGYCYEWNSNGVPLNGGAPVSNYYCESENPSYYYWGQGQNRWGYCYQFTPYGVAMNQGRPQGNYYCESQNPSYYDWGRGQNGYTYCYQFTSNGYVMNDGRPVNNYYCR